MLVSILRSIVIALELLDPHEQLQELLRDPEYTIQRVAELSDAPYTWEADRFPCRSVLHNHAQYWRQVERLAERGMETRLHHYAEYDALRRHAHMAVEVLDDLHDATNPVFYVPARRMALKRVRDTIDPLCWQLGVAP